jgi:hypothetical protein
MADIKLSLPGFETPVRTIPPSLAASSAYLRESAPGRSLSSYETTLIWSKTPRVTVSIYSQRGLYRHSSTWNCASQHRSQGPVPLAGTSAHDVICLSSFARCPLLRSNCLKLLTNTSTVPPCPAVRIAEALYEGWM